MASWAFSGKGVMEVRSSVWGRGGEVGKGTSDAGPVSAPPAAFLSSITASDVSENRTGIVGLLELWTGFSSPSVQTRHTQIGRGSAITDVSRQKPLLNEQYWRESRRGGARLEGNMGPPRSRLAVFDLTPHCSISPRYFSSRAWKRGWSETDGTIALVWPVIGSRAPDTCLARRWSP